MRYVKVLILALFFFLCLVFLFQNQNVLSQKLTLELNLLAIPKMTSIELPFYFIILVSFLAGCVMALNTVWLISDTANALMAFPNLIGILLLSPKIVQIIREEIQKDPGFRF